MSTLSRIIGLGLLAVTRLVLILHLCYGLPFEFLSSEVFILHLSHLNFSLPTPDVSYRSSLLNRPDLPSYLQYTYSPTVHAGFIYGAPPEDVSSLKLEVIATDKNTYNTSRRIFDLNILKKPVKPNEIRFKITNLNIDELMVGSRWETLKQIIVEDLWKESSKDGAVTSLLPATQKGDQLPLLPHDKEGVYISYGSAEPFSLDLLELETEVKPLWERRPCPAYYKKTSFERFFRKEGFAVDWCSFKLHTHKYKTPPKVVPKQNAAINALLQDTPVKLAARSSVPSRSYVWDVIKTLLIPLLVMMVLLGLLSLAMCCHRAQMMPTTRGIQMVHYAGVNKAIGAMRSVRGLADGREYSPHPSTGTTTTHVDTLPRSRTASPSSTLPRSSATPSRRFEDYATLNRPDPPPYHRNGSTHLRYEDDGNE